jgi:hypothetical protein
VLQHNDTTEKSAINVRRTDVPCPWCKSKGATVKNGVYHCPRCGYEQDVSGDHEIKVIGWTTEKDSDYPEMDCKTSEIYDAVVKEVKECRYSFAWGEHQSAELPCTPVINNGYKISCGPRTWASIMAEAHSDGETSEEKYAEYYFTLIENPIYPKKSVNREEIIPFEIEE